MTSRLKKKLENLGLDTSSGSSKLSENFCLIGTPLPPLEKAKDAGEFQPLWKQEVRDEQGRRRLHGAFTGGFSAGYFNTVGSKEGWAPSTFISSRSARAAKPAAKPEDFMDEEDMAEMRESQKLVDTSEEADPFAGTRGSKLPSGEDDSISSALRDLVPPTKDSSGARLLQKMGWRPGQGVGPRVTYAKLKLQDLQSSSLSSNVKPGVDDVDEEASKHLFAPRDTKTIQYRPKDNSYGLGYSLGPGLRESSSLKDETKKGVNISAGFGLGALNDADDDDIDVYDGNVVQGPRRRLAYDVDSDEDDAFIVGAKPQRKQNKVVQPASTFHDGRPAPSGFVVAEKLVSEDKWFPLPDIPKGWKPNPRGVWETASQLLEQETIPPRADKGNQRAPAMTADNRGALLGEARLAAEPKSVFDYLSEKDRERLKSFSKAKETVLAPTGNLTPVLAETHFEIPTPSLHPSVAKAALRGFQPFAADPVKQARYSAFLDHYSSPDMVPPLSRQAHQTAEDFSMELSGFAKSATIFKPATGAMANRFTSAVVIDTGAKVVEGLHQPSLSENHLDSPNAEEEARKAKELEEKEAQDPKKNAAKMGMFGPLTRETSTWQPDKLVLKRFGVKDPYPTGLSSSTDDTFPSKPGTNASDSTNSVERLSITQTETTVTSTSTTAESSAGSTISGRRDVSNIGLGEDETQGKDTLTYERPSRDIFKAIFASDDEDSDDEQMDVDPPPMVADSPQVRVGDAESKHPEASMPADLATFKPTFVSRTERNGGGDAKKQHKDPKDKKDKRKKAKAIVSFQDSEGEGDALTIRPTKEKKKRRREKEEGGDANDDKRLKKAEPHGEEDAWVEKAPPLITQASALGESGHSGRMKASDFM